MSKGSGDGHFLELSRIHCVRGYSVGYIVSGGNRDALFLELSRIHCVRGHSVGYSVSEGRILGQSNLT